HPTGSGGPDRPSLSTRGEGSRVRLRRAGPPRRQPGLDQIAPALHCKVLSPTIELVPGRNYLPGLFGYTRRGRADPSPEIQNARRGEEKTEWDYRPRVPRPPPRWGCLEGAAFRPPASGGSSTGPRGTASRPSAR